MDVSKALDERLEEFARTITPKEAFVVGGLAVYLNTGIPRNTDDIDIVVTDNSIGPKVFRLSDNYRVDSNFPDDVFDSIVLTDLELRERAIYQKDLPSGNPVAYLGPEGMIATKLTSLTYSNSPEQPRPGIKVLRDRDVIDVVNLLKMGLDEKLLDDLLNTVPHLQDVDTLKFMGYAQRVLSEPNAPLAFTKNVYGIARLLSSGKATNPDSVYESIKIEAETRYVPDFALELEEMYNL